jgi:endonuclease/exonuclease/phosphatase family metal-dependent hydrolase
MSNVLLGCGGGSTSINIQTSILPANTLGVPQSSIRVMAYNIWFGAGVNPAHTERGSNMNRLADLIALVKQADPDILGLEEVTEWTSGNPATIDQFAAALKMNYYLAQSWRGINTAVFSKFPIRETENLSEYIGNNGALRAVVQTPDGKMINVVVVHLDPRDQVLRSCQFDKLRRIMESHNHEISILMGDINSLPGSSEANYLTYGGWQLAQSETIDDIFVHSRQAWRAEGMCFSTTPSNPDCILDAGISDHRPVGATLSFFDAPNTSSFISLYTPTPISGCDFNRAPAAPPDDSFDGAVLDATKWRDLSYNGGIVRQDGRLILSTDGAQPSSGAMIQSKWNLVGNFDIQAEFQISQEWGVPAKDHVNGAYLGVKISGQNYHITRIRSKEEEKFFAWSTTGALSVNHPATALAGKYRLVRNDTTLNLYYDIGAGWQELASVTVPAEPALVYLGNSTVNVAQALTSYFDNFVINAGSAAY